VDTTLNGELGYAFVVSVFDAAILSWIALQWYRRSVSRIMRRPAGFSDPPEPKESGSSAASASSSEGEPLMTVFESSKLSPISTAQSLPAGVWRRLTIAYGIGAFLYSVVMTTAISISMWPVTVAAIVAQLWANAWLVLPALIALLLLDWKRSLGLSGLFVTVGVVLVPIVGIANQAARGAPITSPLSNAFNSIVLLVQFTYVPLFLLALTGRRRIRAVMAPALAGTLLFGFGLFVFRRVVVEAFNVAALKTLILDAAVLTSSQAAYYGVFMMLALPVGWVTWLAFNWLASAYSGHTFSDIQLMVDCWVLIVAAQSTVTHLVTEYGVAGVALGAAAFAAYRAGAAMTLRLLPLPPVRQGAHDVNRLLLLRVFGYQKRTETLFDHIAQRWRFRGPVQLIAGADLAMRTVDPGDILAFVSGHLRDQYVSSIDEVPARIAHLDLERDPDARFRINELYCLHDTWQQTILALLAVTDVIVMDVRGFTEERKGARFELQQIVTRIPSDRIVLISDQTTNEALLEQTLRAARTRARREGTVPQNGQLALVRVERNSRRELDGVMSRLLGHGDPLQVQPRSGFPA
jgi:hypothetical protein